VPDRFETWLVAQSEWEKGITSEEQNMGAYVGEVYTSEESHRTIFSSSELATLVFVYVKFQHFTAKQIQEYSHRKKGFQKTKNGDLIAYQFAGDLQI
jgi:hypothetical protein